MTMACAVGPSSVSETSILASHPGGVIALQPRERAAGELHRRPSPGKIDDTHIAPENAASQTGTERFGAGFLGGEALGIGFDGIRPPFGFVAFGRREDAAEKPLAVSLDDVGDPPHVDDIGTEADDHAPAFLRPRSIAARMNFTVSESPSNTASPIRKWPMLSSTTCGSEAIVSAVP